MPTVDELFGLLLERGCIPHYRDPSKETDPRKQEKLRRLSKQLDEQRDGNGRVHPLYYRHENGRVMARNPNILMTHTFRPGRGQELISVAPQSIEAAWWAMKKGEEELARNIAWRRVVPALGMQDYPTREVKMSFFGGIYGRTSEVPHWPEICRRFPGLRQEWESQEARKSDVRELQREITDIVLQVACEFEEAHPGYLVAMKHDDLVLEGDNVERFTHFLQERYRLATGLPFKMAWDGEVKDYSQMDTRTTSRLSLLFED